MTVSRYYQIYFSAKTFIIFTGLFINWLHLFVK